MNSDLLTTDLLAQDWWDLTMTITCNNSFDEDTFSRLLQDTYTAVRQYSTENCICRDAMDLYKNICAFLGTRFAPISYAHSAACELTDAMLTHCFCGEKKDTLTSKGTWCLLSVDIDVDFEHVEEEHFNWKIDIEKLSDMGLW